MYFCKLDSWVNFSFQLLKIQVRRSPLWKIQQHPPLPFGPGRPFFIFRSVPTQLPSSWPLCVGKRTHWNGSKHDPSYRYHLVHLSLHTGDAPSQALLLAFCGKLFPASFRKGNQLGPHFSSKRNDWDRTCFLEHERPPLSSCHRRRHWTLIGCGHPSLLSERERSKTLHCLKKNRLMFLLTVLAAILALMGDKGQLFHDFRDETMEELSELFVYLQVFFFIHQYRIAWPFYRFRISWMEAALLGRFFDSKRWISWKLWGKIISIRDYYFHIF